MENCLLMAMVNHTPVSYWLSMSLIELIEWIEVAISLKRKGKN